MKQRKKLTAEHIVKKLEEYKPQLQQYGVKKIGLFGSYAKRKDHKKSDIDILVTFDHPTFDTYM